MGGIPHQRQILRLSLRVERRARGGQQFCHCRRVAPQLCHDMRDEGGNGEDARQKREHDPGCAVKGPECRVDARNPLQRHEIRQAQGQCRPG